jgi:hypothetical protein
MMSELYQVYLFEGSEKSLGEVSTQGLLWRVLPYWDFPLERFSSLRVVQFDGWLTVLTYEKRGIRRTPTRGWNELPPLDFATARVRVSGFLIVSTSTTSVEVWSASPDAHSRAEQNDPTNDVSVSVAFESESTDFVLLSASHWERTPKQSFSSGARVWVADD